MNHPYRFRYEKTFLGQVIGYFVIFGRKLAFGQRGHYFTWVAYGLRAQVGICQNNGVAEQPNSRKRLFFFQNPKQPNSRQPNSRIAGGYFFSKSEIAEQPNSRFFVKTQIAEQLNSRFFLENLNFWYSKFKRSLN